MTESRRLATISNCAQGVAGFFIGAIGLGVIVSSARGNIPNLSGIAPFLIVPTAGLLGTLPFSIVANKKALKASYLMNRQIKRHADLTGAGLKLSFPKLDAKTIEQLDKGYNRIQELKAKLSENEGLIVKSSEDLAIGSLVKIIVANGLLVVGEVVSIEDDNILVRLFPTEGNIALTSAPKNSIQIIKVD